MFLRVRRGSIAVSRALVDGWSTTSVCRQHKRLDLPRTPGTGEIFSLVIPKKESPESEVRTDILKQESVSFDRGIQKELVGERGLVTIGRILVDLATLAIYGGL